MFDFDIKLSTKKPVEHGPTGFSFSRCCSEFA